MQIRQLFGAVIPVMMVIHGIVADSNACPVQRISLSERPCRIIYSKQHLSVYPACLPVVRHQGKPVCRREFTVRNADILQPELRLDIIYEPESHVLCRHVCLVTGFPVHIKHIAIEVIPFYRPVEHIFSRRKFPVVQHLLHCPQRLHPVSVARILAAIPVQVRIITFRPSYGHICIRTVIFKDSDPCHILDYTVTFLRRNGLAGNISRIHPCMAADPGHFHHIPCLGAVDDDFCPDCGFSAGTGINETELPIFSCPADIFQTNTLGHIEARLCRSHIVQDFSPDGRLEHYIAHPACLQRIVTAVSNGNRIAEFRENAPSHAVIAVNCTHTGRSQHSPQPRLLDCYHDRGTRSGRTDSGSSSSRASSDHHYIIGAGA